MSRHHHFSAKQLKDLPFRRALYICLAINFSMFIVEIIAGIYAHSLSILADSLDFLSDSATYLIALYVMEKSLRTRSYAALFNALTMLGVAGWVIYRALMKYYYPEIPLFEIMAITGTIALIANVVCAMLLYHHRKGDSNRASIWLCSRNDALNNLAIIIAAGVVFFTNSIWPDLIVAAWIVGLEVYSAFHIISHVRKDMAKK